MKIVRKRKHAKIGDKFIYKHFDKNDALLTVVAESPDPGYRGYYDYLCKVEKKKEGKVTHAVIHGADLINPNGVYHRLK